VRRMRTTSTQDAATGPPAPGEPEGSRSRIPRLLAPVLLIALAAAIIWSSLSLGYWTDLGPGPGFFPLWLAVLLAVLSGVWLVEQVRRVGESATAAAEEAAGTDIPEEPDTPLAARELAAIVISLIVLALLLEVLGFQLSMLLFLVFHLKVLGRRRWPLTIVLSLLGSFGIYTLFAQVLAVALPVSAIPFLQSLGL
jgi:putative tricarboxylic transport membrane protein